MIEIRREGCRGGRFNVGNYGWEGGASDVVYLPDSSLTREGERVVRISGKYLGSHFGNGPSYEMLKTHVRIVPELPLNQVIGIPSLKGMIFGDDDA
ncbi:hypothetical protein HWA86_gp43 [Pseudoalteromonas phage HP1]|jgi:hypothetical protein|uniref:hypothetical protein n=1 Tax=Pseudoalteromonas phage HP1 TaxID=1357706 RepID=UPI0018AF6D23|nr:hypothetical protein HWA86_gp43 [Pseudoalteromonas phage HP1]